MRNSYLCSSLHMAMKKIALSFIGLLLSVSAAFAQPSTTRPPQNMVLTTCSTNVPLVSSGVNAPSQCWATGALGAAAALSLPIGVASGGTGLSTVAAHNLLAGNGTSAMTPILTGTAGRLLIDQGASLDPAFFALSGDATVSSSGVLSLGSNVVSNAKFRQSAALSVVGNPSNGTANVQDIAGVANQTLVVNNAGTALAFGQLNLASSAAVTGNLALANGGANASLTASNGGIVYSTGSALAILAGTATANQIVLSGSSTSPAWSTNTFPSTAAAGTILAAGTANTITATATPTHGINGSVTGQVLLANGGGSGATVTVQNNSATSAYNFNLPVDAGSTVGTARGPLISGGGTTNPMVWATRSGSTTQFGTVSGAFAASDCVQFDGSGNLVSAGGVCSVGSGSGTVTAGIAGQIPYYVTSTNAVAGNANLNIAAGALTIGQASSVIGQLKLAGNTSGTVTVTPAAAAGTWTMTLPTTGGTNLFFLQTNGSGVTTWAAGGTLSSIAFAYGLTGGTITTTGTVTAPLISQTSAYGAL